MQWILPDYLKQKIKSLHYKLPKNFDFRTYLLLYPDLREAGISTEEEAIEHFILFGEKENRIYCNTNPELNNIEIEKYNYNNEIYLHETINHLFDKIYIISLKNKNHQLIKNYFNKFDIQYQLVYGIDGNIDKKTKTIYEDYIRWSEHDPRRHVLDHNPNKRLILGPGAIGLFLTYKKIFREAIKNKYKYILVFEDDCLFDKNINLHINNFFRSNINFDLLFLGASHHAWNNPKIYSIADTETNYYKAPQVLDGTFAIAYNCKILPNLLRHMSVINSPIDSGPVREILKNNNSYVISPNTAIADTTLSSSISNIGRNLRTHKLSMRWNLKNIDFTRGMHKVSIILANYNSEKTISRCIDSVLTQTYPNFELIIIDDNSEDNCKNIIKKYLKKDNRIKLIELDKNIGAYKCRNIGIKNSNGFFITLLDGDDILLSKKIEIDIYNYFNFQQYDLFFSNIYRSKNLDLNELTTDSKVVEEIEIERSQHIFKNKNSTYLYGHDTPWEYKLRFGLPTIFTDRSFFDQYGLWNEKHRYGMDLELIQRYVLKKYNEFIDHETLWAKIYHYQANNYGIYLSPTTNYVSFPINNNNATIKCTKSEREKIHKICNKNFKKQIKKNKNKINTSEIFCIVKNEQDIIKYFLEYHLPIVDSITLVDNGSSDKTLDIAKQYPIKIIQNTSHFSNKALIISDLMKHSHYDILIPMDIDEFMILDQQHNKKTSNKKLIKKYLNNLVLDTSKFQMKQIYEYCPFKKNNWDITQHTKVWFYNKNFIAVDAGYHSGTTTDNSIKTIDVSYCHFHFRSKAIWEKNTKQKLQARLGKKWNNMEALMSYRGDSSHCVHEWINYLTTGQWHNLQPRVKFRFNNMTFDS